MKRSVFGSVHAKITQNIGSKGAPLQKIPLKKLFYFSFLLNLLSIAGIVLVYNRLPPEVPLFYGLPQGEDQLSEKNGLFATGIFGLAIVIVNFIITNFTKNDLLKKALIVAGFAVSFLSLYTTYQIVFLIGNV